MTFRYKSLAVSVVPQFYIRVNLFIIICLERKKIGKKVFELRTLLIHLELCDDEHDVYCDCSRIGQFHRLSLPILFPGERKKRCKIFVLIKSSFKTFTSMISITDDHNIDIVDNGGVIHLQVLTRRLHHLVNLVFD